MQISLEKKEIYGPAQEKAYIMRLVGGKKEKDSSLGSA